MTEPVEGYDPNDENAVNDEFESVNEVPPPPATPYVLEDLTEEECYLAAILMDRSGLDLAEFTWVDERIEAPGNTYRAWPFQWAWWRCMDQKQIDQCGRAIGKSESLKSRACIFPFAHPDGEMVITAPQGIHVDAITDRIESQFTATRLMREMLVKGRESIKHHPFRVRFANGARIISRIPQRDGSGIKGCFPRGSLVLTRHGMKAIEDVEEGDLVLSHRYRWQRVTATHRYEDLVVRLRIAGQAPIVVSTTQPLWARFSADEPDEWIRVLDLAMCPTAEVALATMQDQGDLVERAALLRPWLAKSTEREDGRRELVVTEHAEALFVRFLAQSLGWAVTSQRSPSTGREKLTFRPDASGTHRQVIAVENLDGTPFDPIVYQYWVDEDERTELFDLTVEEDHSFIVEGLLAANTHPIWLEMDEGQDYPERGWSEIRSTLERHRQGSQWRVHGVTRGLYDEFDKMAQPGSGFTVHHFTAMHKPTWTQAEKLELIEEFGGSKESPDYRRNVLGFPGDQTNAVFILDRLMRCCDKQKGSDYNSHEYYYRQVTIEEIEDRTQRAGLRPEDRGKVLADLLELPAIHKTKYGPKARFWAGMDVGRTKDPSEILVFVEYVPSAKERKEDLARKIAVPPEGQTRFKLIARLKFVRVPYTVQVPALYRVVEFYNPVAFSMDKTGNGLAMLEYLQQEAGVSRFAIEFSAGEEEHVPRAPRGEAQQTFTVIKGYGFHEKILVAIDEQRAAQLGNVDKEELAKKAGVWKVVKEYATDQMRELVDNDRWLMPLDEDFIKQITGQTWSYNPNPNAVDPNGDRLRRYSEGTFHAFDGARMAVLGMVQQPIEAFFTKPEKKKKRGLAMPVWEPE